MRLQSVKKIKGGSDKKRAKNVTCKQGLMSWSTHFCDVADDTGFMTLHVLSVNGP